MGSCISKCKPKKTPIKERQHGEFLVVQDKVVISQAPISSSPPSKKPLICVNSPPNVPSSPSFSCTNSNYPTMSSSSSSFLSLTSSSSSSVVSSELDSSMEDPHIIHHGYSINKTANSRRRSSIHTRCYISGNKPNGPKQHPPTPQKVTRPTTQKRSRCSSPSNLTRQKSFRREPDRAITSNSSSNLTHQKSFRREPERPISRSGRDLRPISPSPSRRFKGEAMTSSMRRTNDGTNSRRSNNGSKGRRDNEGVNGVRSKLEELAIGEDLVFGHENEMDWMPIEDVNNPHIALDCFIFL